MKLVVIFLAIGLVVASPGDETKGSSSSAKPESEKSKEESARSLTAEESPGNLQMNPNLVSVQPGHILNPAFAYPGIQQQLQTPLIGPQLPLAVQQQPLLAQQQPLLAQQQQPLLSQQQPLIGAQPLGIGAATPLVAQQQPVVAAQQPLLHQQSIVGQRNIPIPQQSYLAQQQPLQAALWQQQPALAVAPTVGSPLVATAASPGQNLVLTTPMQSRQIPVDKDKKIKENEALPAAGIAPQAASFPATTLPAQSFINPGFTQIPQMQQQIPLGANMPLAPGQQIPLGANMPFAPAQQQFGGFGTPCIMPQTMIPNQAALSQGQLVGHSAFPQISPQPTNLIQAAPAPPQMVQSPTRFGPQKNNFALQQGGAGAFFPYSPYNTPLWSPAQSYAPLPLCGFGGCGPAYGPGLNEPDSLAPLDPISGF